MPHATFIAKSLALLTIAFGLSALAGKTSADPLDEPPAAAAWGDVGAPAVLPPTLRLGSFGDSISARLGLSESPLPPAPAAPDWESLRAPAGSGLRARELRLSLGFDVSQRSRLVVDHVILRSPGVASGLGRETEDRPVGIGLEFKSVNASQLAGLRQGTLFKVNLGNSSALGLRARKGRLVLVWRAQW